MQHHQQILPYRMHLMIKLVQLPVFIKWRVPLVLRFGVAISATVYAMISINSGVDAAATGGIITNVIFAVIALLSIIVLWFQTMLVNK